MQTVYIVPLFELRNLAQPSQGQCFKRGFVRVDCKGEEVAAEGEDYKVKEEGEGWFRL